MNIFSGLVEIGHRYKDGGKRKIKEFHPLKKDATTYLDEEEKETRWKVLGETKETTINDNRERNHQGAMRREKLKPGGKTKIL